MAALLYKHDVFLSFRGEDTRKNFVSHLYEALVESRINTFKDDKKLEKGTSIPEELPKAIDESQFAIVILSMNYATSSWCLDELVRIIEGKIQRDLTVVPIFYRVSPSEVGEQRKMFAEAFKKHEVNVDREKVQIWRDALNEAAKLPGWEIRQYRDSEAQIIEEVVKYILNKKKLEQQHTPINNLLEANSPNGSSWPATLDFLPFLSSLSSPPLSLSLSFFFCVR